MPIYEVRYSLRELVAAATDAEGGPFDARAARDYINTGLLPPMRTATDQPYGEDHLLRLRLIIRLTRQYVPLKEIQRFLDRLSSAGLRGLLDRSSLVRFPSEGDAHVYLERLLATVPPTMRALAVGPHPVPAVSPAPPAAPRPRAISTRQSGMTAREVQRSEWLHVAVDPDVELLVRMRSGYDAHKLASRLSEALLWALATEAGG